MDPIPFLASCKAYGRLRSDPGLRAEAARTQDMHPLVKPVVDQLASHFMYIASQTDAHAVVLEIAQKLTIADASFDIRHRMDARPRAMKRVDRKGDRTQYSV